MFIANYIHFLRCYAKKNQHIDASLIQKNVVVSMTTTPARITKIWPTLNSIALQSIKPEKIYLWIPKKFKRFNHETISRIPHFIQANPYIHVEWINDDFGPATKLLPCLKLLEEQDTNIIMIDDDRIYPPHLIRDFLIHERTDPYSALGIAGTIVHGSERREYRSRRNITLVDVLLGYNGCLVKPSFFSKEVFNYPSDLPEAFFEDDVWFSGHLKKMGVRRLLIPSIAGWQNIITGNKNSFGLCMYENKDKRNFIHVYNYFNTTLGFSRNKSSITL